MAGEEKTEKAVGGAIATAPKPGEGQKPAPDITQTPEFKEAVRKATSTYQSEASKASKAVKTSQEQITALTAKVNQLTEEIEVAKLAGDDEEEGKRVRERLKVKADLEARAKTLADWETRLQTNARVETIKVLSARYGIPADDLEPLETAAEMEKTAMAHYISQLESKNNGSETGKELATKKPGFDVGQGRTATAVPNLMKMSDKDFNEYARRRARQAGR